MAPRKFSLAAALWDFPQADDCAAPTQHVPDSWRILFEDDSTDSQVVVVVILHRRPPAWLWMVLHGMFSACPSGKQWTLRRAKSAKLTLDCTGPQADDPARQRQLQTLRQDLAVRGCLPTALQLQYEPTASSQEAVASCAEALGPSNSSVSSVTLTPSLPTHELLTAQAMTRAASALSNITMLTLGGCVERLPDPSHLLHLKHLHIPLLPYPDTGFDDNMCASLAPYLQQLTSLHLSERKDAPSISEEDEHLYVTRWTQIYWDKIFTTPTTTLTHFTTGADLDDEILGLLVEYAPALKHLSVRVLRLRDGDMGVKTWGVEKLSLTGVGTEEHIRARDHTEMQFDGGLLALELELLPRQQPGRVLTISTPQARERPYLSIPYIAYASVRLTHMRAPNLMHASNLIHAPNLMHASNTHACTLLYTCMHTCPPVSIQLLRTAASRYSHACAVLLTSAGYAHIHQ